MELLKAHEANLIASENNPDYIIKEIARRIAKTSESGQFSLKVRDYGFGSSRLYPLASELSERQKKIVEKLKANGYSTELKVEESKFVDMYLEIKW